MRLDTLPPERVTELARGLATGAWMFADLDDEEWVDSLTLILSGLKEVPENVACVLVPLAPHQRMMWLNGRVPAVTVEALFVPTENFDSLVEQHAAMWAALHPEETA